MNVSHRHFDRRNGTKRIPGSRPLAALACLTLVLAMQAYGGDQPLGPKDGAELGATDLDRVKPGVTAPDFTLEDQQGHPVTLSEFREHLPVVLVFYRGHW